MALSRGTEGSNPTSSSGESIANLTWSIRANTIEPGGSRLPLRQFRLMSTGVAGRPLVGRDLSITGCWRSSGSCPERSLLAQAREHPPPIPLFDRKPPSLHPDLPPGRAPRAAPVKDAAANAAASAEPAQSVLDRASTVLPLPWRHCITGCHAGLPPRFFRLIIGGRSVPPRSAAKHGRRQGSRNSDET